MPKQLINHDEIDSSFCSISPLSIYKNDESNEIA